MEWNFLLDGYWMIGLIVVIATSLLFGLSLLEVNLTQTIKKICYISIVSGAFFYVLQMWISYNIIIVFIYLTLIPLIWYFLRISIPQAIIASLLAFIYDLTIVKLLTYNLFDLALMNTNISSDIVMQIALSAFVILTNIFIAIIIFKKPLVLFPKRWLDPRNELDEQNGEVFHILFIMLILILLTVFLYYSYTELVFFRPNYRVFVMFWSLLTCGLIFFFLRNIAIHNIERLQFSIDKAYQKDILNFYNMIRSQRHDFNIHLNAIFGLISSKKYDECNAYIEEIIGETRVINELLPLHHPATAAMLATLRLDAFQKGITLSFHLQDNLKDMPCTIYETNKILGNLIQNAIEETEANKSSDSVIHIEITKEYYSIILKVTNDTTISEEDLNHMFDIGFSTKNLHDGIGLPAIMDIVSLYGGVIFPEINNGSITMNTRIPLLDN